MNETSASTTSSGCAHAEITLLIGRLPLPLYLYKTQTFAVFVRERERETWDVCYLSSPGAILSRLRARLPAQGVELAELPRDPLESAWSLQHSQPLRVIRGHDFSV